MHPVQGVQTRGLIRPCCTGACSQAASSNGSSHSCTSSPCRARAHTPEAPGPLSTSCLGPQQHAAQPGHALARPVGTRSCTQAPSGPPPACQIGPSAHTGPRGPSQHVGSFSQPQADAGPAPPTPSRSADLGRGGRLHLPAQGLARCGPMRVLPLCKVNWHVCMFTVWQPLRQGMLLESEPALRWS